MEADDSPWRALRGGQPKGSGERSTWRESEHNFLYHIQWCFNTVQWVTAEASTHDSWVCPCLYINTKSDTQSAWRLPVKNAPSSAHACKHTQTLIGFGPVTPRVCFVITKHSVNISQHMVTVAMAARQQHSAPALKHGAVVLFNIWIRMSTACFYHIILSQRRRLLDARSAPPSCCYVWALSHNNNKGQNAGWPLG